MISPSFFIHILLASSITQPAFALQLRDQASDATIEQSLSDAIFS